MDKKIEVPIVIIGSGQAGLALGKALKDAHLSFLILEENASVGDGWRRHYDSLILFTPRRFSALPGLPIEGNLDTCATKDEFADYLERYAGTFELPIEYKKRVRSVTKEGSIFTVEAASAHYTARAVVVCTGHGAPVFIPSDDSLPLLHSSEYKNPSQVTGNRVLVVGAGNSGAQIAVELSKTHEVSLSYEKKPRFISTSYFGRSFYFWSELFKTNRIPVDTWFGKLFAKDKDYIVGYDLLHALYAGRVKRKAPVLRIRGGKVHFANGVAEPFDAVICATGFKNLYPFLSSLPGALGDDGTPLHTRGVSSVPGLFFSGMRNQISNVSGNIHGTHINTPYILKHLESYLRYNTKE